MKLQLALLVALPFVALGAVAEEQAERVLWTCPSGSACSYNCENHCKIACDKLHIPYKSSSQCSRVHTRRELARELASAQTYKTCSTPRPSRALGEEGDDRDLAGAQNDTGLCCYCHRAPTPAPTRKPTTRKPTTRKPTTRKPTTRKPTTRKPTTRQPTATPTSKPTTAKPTPLPTDACDDAGGVCAFSCGSGGDIDCEDVCAVQQPGETYPGPSACQNVGGGDGNAACQARDTVAFNVCCKCDIARR